MKKTKIRVVIDTNLWVSFVINRFNSQLIDVLTNPNVEIISSKELNLEIFETIGNQKLQKYIRPFYKDEFIMVYPEIVKLIRVKTMVEVCRDSKDNFLLGLSQDGRADFLISGDKDVLVLGQFYQTKIVRLPEFLQII
jgi:uncharacterized protein